MRFVRRVTSAAPLAVALLALLVAGACGDDVTTTAGKKLTGKLVGVDAQGITFSTADAKVPIPGRDIVVVDLGNPVAAVPNRADCRSYSRQATMGEPGCGAGGGQGD